MTTPEKIKFYREKFGMTQQELANNIQKLHVYVLLQSGMSLRR